VRVFVGQTFCRPRSPFVLTAIPLVGWLFGLIIILFGLGTLWLLSRKEAKGVETTGAESVAKAEGCSVHRYLRRLLLGKDAGQARSCLETTLFPQQRAVTRWLWLSVRL
jgi:hypothetical protein